MCPVGGTLVPDVITTAGLRGVWSCCGAPSWVTTEGFEGGAHHTFEVERIHLPVWEVRVLGWACGPGATGEAYPVGLTEQDEPIDR